MAVATPDMITRRGIEPGLVATIAASAAIHAALLVLLVTLPGRLLQRAPKLESYTVDLVAPNTIGGTNLMPGGGRAKAPPEPPPAVAPKPAPVEPAAAKPVVEPPAAPPVPVAPAPKVAAPAEPVVAPKPPEPPKPVEAPKPVEQAPKPVQPPPAPAAKPADAKPIAPKPPPLADAKPAEARAPAKPAEAPKPPAKVAEPSKPIAPAAAKPAAVNPPAMEEQKKPAEPPANRAAEKRDDAIAAAVQRRAAQVQGGAAANPEVDKQIAAAVQRRAQQVGQGAGPAAAESGGPVSIGPGSGVGGTPADLQYILYQGRMEERIKAAWAWAGADKAQHAVIQFNLTPEGEIKNVHTIESSGDRQYDASCERAVRVVNPLDPVPEKYRKEFATVEMTFKPTDLEH